MGRSRLVPRGLTALLLCLAAGCGGEDDLLEATDTDTFFTGGGSGSSYRPKSMDPAVRGAISGIVKFTGREIRAGRIDLGADKFCTGAQPGGLVAENFRFDPKTGGLEGVIVYVKKGLNAERWETPSTEVVLDQQGCRYIPHIAVVQTGQPLLIKSSDNTLHNVKGAAGANPGFNHAMSRPGSLAPKTLTKPEVAKKIGCDVHGWMTAYVAVMPHPCWAITGPDGAFRVDGVPPGTYLLAAWHEELGEIEAEVKLAENGTLNHVFTFERK